MMKQRKIIERKLKELKENDDGICSLCGCIVQEDSCIEALSWVLGIKEGEI